MHHVVSRLVVFFLGLLAVVAIVLFFRREAPHHSRQRLPLSRFRQLPNDPLAYVPTSARTLVVADLNRLREAPVTRAWFDPPSNTGPSCQERIARHVQMLALVVPRLPPEEFAFVAAGDLTPADLARCAPDAETTARQGFAFTIVRSRRDGGHGAIVAWTPRGVVLVGSVAVVEAMLDHAIDVARGHAPRPFFEDLRSLVNPHAALWGLHRSHEDGPPGDPLAAVSVGALSVMVSDAVVAEATLRCDDSSHARRVEETLLRVRRESLEALTHPHLRAALERASVSVDGIDVRFRTSLSAEATSALGTTVTEFVGRIVGTL
jgi:hypothetical protein